MPQHKTMLDQFPLDLRHVVSNPDDILTPALLLYPDAISANIERTVQLLENRPSRWRVHIKTAKLAHTLHMFLERGIRNFKCATTLELLVACQAGADDVLFAYPAMGANARRACEIAAQFPRVRVSALIENEAQLAQWRGGSVGIFLDINSGMNRTGVEQSHADQIVRLADAVRDASLEFRGLHYYDGHLGGFDEPERTVVAHRGYNSLLQLIGALQSAGIATAEVITSGTPALPCSISYPGFRDAGFAHRVSPGTVVYHDATSLAQFPANCGYQPAVLVLARVVSNPRPGIITCDAGHKSVSADAGVPTCLVLGHPELTPLAPSEEHLPLAINESAAASLANGGLSSATRPPQVGDLLYLLPRHVCPTVNNFDSALLVRNSQILSQQPVTARGHEPALLTKAKVAHQQAATASEA